jgi:hypothetical protein
MRGLPSRFVVMIKVDKSPRLQVVWQPSCNGSQQIGKPKPHDGAGPHDVPGVSTGLICKQHVDIRWTALLEWASGIMNASDRHCVRAYLRARRRLCDGMSSIRHGDLIIICR